MLMISEFFSRFDKRIDPDVLFALSWKKPSTIQVRIQQTDNGYFAKVINLDGNVVTEAKTGQELFEMVNDAIYEYLDVPYKYRDKLGYFMPPEEVREELKVTIPSKYLDTNIEAFATV